MNAFRPVKSQKISARIGQQIKGAILRGAMKPGDKLPPERELVGRFKASRISVREALKSLETSGLLTIKPGSGVFVAEVNSKSLTDSLSSILRIKKVSMNELTEARMVLEPNITRFACERINSQDLRKLKGNIEEAVAIIKSNVSARLKNIEFHFILAESTRNAVLALTMKTMLDVLKDMSSDIVNNSPKNIEVASHTVRHHRRILKALEKRDAQKVYELMMNHIRQIQGSLNQTGVNRE